ncbi:MAG: DUF421 domain-containing protein [Bacteroidota bacterium]|nr:DUF421 domain-containing protein [Bacteroidota bacterium]
MKDFFADLIGLHETAQTISAGQISARTVVVFLVALVLLRLSGRRTFASNSALEMIVKFMLGATLSRAIAADAPFFTILAAAGTLVLVHRVLAYLTYFFPALGRLVKGEASLLAEGATIHHKELRRASISKEALRAGVRGAANLDDMAQTEAVRLEHDGTISVVKIAE